MKKQKKFRGMMTLLLALMMVFACTTTTLAAELNNIAQDGREYLIVNGTDIVYVGEDYQNPETGEYIYWKNNARGVDKEFSFKVRWSVTSSNFTVSSEKVRVTADASVVDYADVPQSGYEGHLYTVTISGVYSRDLQFDIGGIETGTINNLVKGGTYRVTITNNDFLEDGRFLYGDGKIEGI